jgi:HD-like signal output (HDOD) protein/CheY-like chemotaxis protein
MVNPVQASQPAKPTTVLFVDDDRSLLDGLRRTLHRKVDNWQLLFAESGESALALLQKHEIDVVISDMRMPGMNGVEFLRTVKECYPKTLRFILSGYSDRAMILESIGITHQFFSKPCEPEHLIHAIRFSSSLYQNLSSECVQRVICNIADLPVPPVTYTEMTQELNSPEPSIERLSALVMRDASISARVLQMVNSAFFGIGRPIADINQATMFLGIENLRSLVLILGLSNETFSNLSHTFDLAAFTVHSVEVGTTAQLIATDLGWSRSHAQVAFTAGLLHDMGKLVMATHFGATYCKETAFAMRTPDTIATQELENQRFGTNHAEIGAALLALWGFRQTSSTRLPTITTLRMTSSPGCRCLASFTSPTPSCSIASQPVPRKISYSPC